MNSITVRGNQRIPNNDGIHLSSCRHVLITHCDIVTGDDGIAISGIDDWERESTHIHITNCSISSVSSAIRIGYWRSKVSGVRVVRCKLHDSGRGICIMACGSGYVHNVVISNIQIDTFPRAGSWWAGGEAIVLNTANFQAHNRDGVNWDTRDRAVHIRNLEISDLSVVSPVGIVIFGKTPDIQDVSFLHCNITLVDFPDPQLFGTHLNLSPSQANVPVKEGLQLWLFVSNVINLSVKDVDVLNETVGRVEQNITNSDGSISIDWHVQR